MIRFVFRAAAIVLVLVTCSYAAAPPPLDTEGLRTMIGQFKADNRGPFQAIRWFCPDGTILPARERCPGPGGFQHALQKESVASLARDHHLFLGQILSGTGFEEFLDASRQYSRLKQYLLEQYLQGVDDGWILRKARFYRGAFQIEDEEKWGRTFLARLLTTPDMAASEFFLIRQAARGIPHRKATSHWHSIRSRSTALSDSYPGFMALRVKLHGSPDPGDIQRLRSFEKTHESGMSPDQINHIRALIQDLEAAYAPVTMEDFRTHASSLPAGSPVRRQLENLVRMYSPDQTQGDPGEDCRRIADLLLVIRQQFAGGPPKESALALMDLSLDLEILLFRLSTAWKPGTCRSLLEKAHILSLAAAGCGFLEGWEWEQFMGPSVISLSGDTIPAPVFMEAADRYRRILESGSGMARAMYDPETALFSTFEPLARGFVDDRIRLSPLLGLGEATGQLLALAHQAMGTENQMTGIRDSGTVRGMNPGFARARLMVVQGNPEETDFREDTIYVLPRVPSEMKPVAGLLAVSEGNLVSHVQLLARNLGIPNAVISTRHLVDLQALSGQQVFFAVSPRGTVLLKPASGMTSQETRLVEKKQRTDERMMIPMDRIDLGQTDLLSLASLRADHSGKVCGPKAANLGQLKHLFPDHVADGLVIPFGVFRSHLDLAMPGTRGTYWQFLENAFGEAACSREKGVPEKEIEKSVLERLEVLRNAIGTMTLSQGFASALETRFLSEFGSPLGTVPVFIRSDTNMEDLKEFTGAGLNLTVFNVRDAGNVLQGIRDVWASPFRERSYLWRQKYMLNPENVFPSILLLPTVAVDTSGVMITTGVAGGDPGDITIAFSSGPGGAVEGQSAETWLLKSDGRNCLVSPSREHRYTILPEAGGILKGYRTFHQPVLAESSLALLRAFAARVKTVLPGTPGIESPGPYDVELGFKDGKLWLFQVRPYVENRRALASDYLQGLDRNASASGSIALDRAVVFPESTP